MIATAVTTIQTSQMPSIVSLGSGYFAIAIPPPATDYNGVSTLAVIDNSSPGSPVVTPVASVQNLSSLFVEGSFLLATNADGMSVYQVTLPQ